MIGKKVPFTEVEKVLEKEHDREYVCDQIKAEMMALDKGECLFYHIIGESSGIQLLALRSLLVEIGDKGLKVVLDGDDIYVYREK